MADTWHLNAWLREEYRERRLRNQRYTLRAFAKLLNVPSGRLSEWMTGTRRLTEEKHREISARLGAEPSEIERRENSKTQQREMTSEAQLALISDWRSLAILNVLNLKTKQKSTRWVARRLGLKIEDVKFLLSSLEQEGLVREKNNSWQRLAKPMRTPDQQKSEYLRLLHHGILQLQALRLDQCAVAERDFSAMVLTMDREKVNQAKEEIRKFRRKFTEKLEGNQANDVYCISIQLSPMTIAGGDHEE